jgi:hypothetical protein
MITMGAGAADDATGAAGASVIGASAWGVAVWGVVVWGATDR